MAKLVTRASTGGAFKQSDANCCHTIVADVVVAAAAVAVVVVGQTNLANFIYKVKF